MIFLCVCCLYCKSKTQINYIDYAPGGDNIQNLSESSEEVKPDHK